MRILVTGSRDWPSSGLPIIKGALQGAASATVEEITVVSGACPTGADRLAEVVAGEMEWPIERHPAEWWRFGKKAGFLRNAEMVDLGADYCLAFIKDCSRGATMTADLAEKSGITTYRWTIGS